MPRTSAQKSFSSPLSSVSPAQQLESGFNFQTPESDDAPLSGLYIFGQVIDRIRRSITTKDQSSTEIVTYTIQDQSGHRYYVDEYSPTSYNDLGAMVELQVYVKTFRKHNGDLGFSFGVQKEQVFSTRGQRF